jgi:CRP/FNR family transcriptional regulator, cyclic AMP receptor protein
MGQVENLSASHPFLVGMSAHHIELLMSCATIREFQERDVIFRIGEPANGFYLIAEGAVDLEDWASKRGTLTIETLVAGEPMGWSWLFPPYRWHYHARAVRPTTAVFFDGTALRQFCNEDHSLGHELFKRMSEVMMRRLHATRAKLIEALNQAQ